MQDDVTDATLWAVEQGIADKDRLCLYGGSYGGYATLQGLVREPDLYKCGIGYVGVYDLETMRACGDIVSHGNKKYLDKVIGKPCAPVVTSCLSGSWRRRRARTHVPVETNGQRPEKSRQGRRH